MTDAPSWFTAALAIAPDVSQTTVDGTSISFRTWGSPGASRDLLLVHGGAAHARWWDFIAPLLAVGRRVVAVDMSGHGDSGHRAAYSVDLWADELVAVIEAGGLGPHPVIAAHSLGGMVSTILAGRGDPQLGGLIVIDSPVEPNGLAPRTEADNTFGKARVYPNEVSAVERFRPIPAQSTLPYAAEYIATNSVRAVEGGWSWKFDPAFVTMTGDFPQTMDGLTCPAVYIAGERGILSPAGRAALDASSDVAVVEIPDAGHAMMLDRPVALVSALRGVLAGWQTTAP